MKNWSASWKGSKKPGKQRKYSIKAPLHTKQHFLHTHISPELRKRYGLRAVRIHKGDTVKVLRGGHKKKIANVSKVQLNQQKIYLDGMFDTRRDGAQAPIPFHPSNLMIISLNLEDKRRQGRIEQKVKK